MHHSRRRLTGRGDIDRTWTLANFHAIFASETYRRIALRTILMALAVTLTDVVLAFPFAYYMVRVAGPIAASVGYSPRRSTTQRAPKRASSQTSQRSLRTITDDARSLNP